MLKETIRIMRRELLPDGTKRNAGIQSVPAAEAAELVDAGDAKYIDKAPAKKLFAKPTAAEQPAEEDLENGS